MGNHFSRLFEKPLSKEFIYSLALTLSVGLVGAWVVRKHVRACRENSPLSIVGLRIYPVKSCGAIDVERAEMTSKGFRYDRRMVIVNPDGKQLTQRQCSKMALIQPVIRLETNTLQLTAPGMPTALEVPLEERAPAAQATSPSSSSSSSNPDSSDEPNPNEGKTIVVDVWGWQGAAQHMGDEAAAWLSTYLQRDVILARQLNSVVRTTERELTIDGQPANTGGNQVSFADGFPYLLCTTASLAQVNRWIVDDSEQQPLVTMRSFRPNIIVSGAQLQPFEEDVWRTIRFANQDVQDLPPVVSKLYNQKLCARCVLTTVNPELGKLRDRYKDLAGNLATLPEPLNTLKKHRTREKGANFGINLVGDVSSFGNSLAIGDLVQIENHGVIGVDIVCE